MDELPPCLRHQPGGEIYVTDGARFFRLRVVVWLISQRWTPEALARESGIDLNALKQGLAFYNQNRDWFDRFFDSAGRLIMPEFGSPEYFRFIQAQRRRRVLFGDKD